MNSSGEILLFCHVEKLIQLSDPFYAGVDGCALENLKCEQRCDFSAQGYRCSCSRGYRLADNKQDCVGKELSSTNSLSFNPPFKRKQHSAVTSLCSQRLPRLPEVRSHTTCFLLGWDDTLSEVAFQHFETFSQPVNSFKKPQNREKKI